MKNTKIYAEILDELALKQFQKAMALECNVQGALMPDAHAGYTLPIGAVIKSKNMVFPAYVGYDIGCGMCAVKLDLTKDSIDFNRVKSLILENIPLGVNRHKKAQDYRPLKMSEMAKEHWKNIGKYQLGTLGGGNHFIEIGEGRDGKIWIVIHSGSRGFGAKVAEFYMKKASEKNFDICKLEEEFERKNADFKKHNEQKFYEAKQMHVQKYSQKLAKLNVESHNGFVLNSLEGQEYIKDMTCALEFALSNRKAMIKKIISFLGTPNELMFINKNHNHAEVMGNFVIHRKGATQAQKGVLGVIPGNMKDGSFIVRGKGNEESLSSSSHGAGRVLSRSQAMKILDFEEFNNQMQGVITNHSKKTIDESPKAYKDIFEVMRLQSDLVETIDHVKPLLNIKG